MVVMVGSNSRLGYFCARVEARAAELVGNVGEGREAHGVGYVAAKVDFVDQGFVAYQGVDVDAKIGGHAIYCVVAFRMHGGIVEGIRSPAMRRNPAAC